MVIWVNVPSSPLLGILCFPLDIACCRWRPNLFQDPHSETFQELEVAGFGGSKTLDLFNRSYFRSLCLSFLRQQRHRTVQQRHRTIWPWLQEWILSQDKYQVPCSPMAWQHNFRQSSVSLKKPHGDDTVHLRLGLEPMGQNPRSSNWGYIPGFTT